MAKKYQYGGLVLLNIAVGLWAYAAAAADGVGGSPIMPGSIVAGPGAFSGSNISAAPADPGFARGFIRPYGIGFGGEYTNGGGHPYAGFYGGQAFGGFSGFHRFNGFAGHMPQLPSFVPPHTYNSGSPFQGGLVPPAPGIFTPYQSR